MHTCPAFRYAAHAPPLAATSTSRGHVGADDERVLAAHLEVHARHPRGAGRRHLLPGLDRARERHAGDALVVDDRRAHVAGAGHQVHHAGGQVREALGQHQRRQRRELGRLRHDRVARGDRRRQLPGEQQQRVVPRHDAAHGADRLLHDERELGGLDRRDHAAGEVAAHLGVVVEGRRGPADLVGVLDQRLAALERHHPRQLVGARAQPRGHLVQQLGALDGRERGPGREGLARGGHGRVELLGRRQPDGGHGLLGGRVLDGERAAVAGDLLAADQQPGLQLREAAAHARGAGLLARAVVAVQGARLHGLVDPRDQAAELLVGAAPRRPRRPRPRGGGTRSSPGKCGAGSRGARAPPDGSAFLVRRCWPSRNATAECSGRRPMATDAPEPAGPRAPRSARNTAFFSFATGLSRLLGLVREVVAAKYFGVTGAMSAFTIAFQVPNLVRALFADSALQGAFVPVFTRAAREGRAEGGVPGRLEPVLPDLPGARRGHGAVHPVRRARS